MKKKLRLISVCVLSAVILAGCSSGQSQQTNQIQLTKPLSEDEYRIVVNTPDQNQDEVHEQNQLQSLMGVQLGTSNSVDVYEFERGLTEASKEHFSPKDYYFQKATFLRYNTVRNWLQRKLTDAEVTEKKLKEPTFVDTGLNPSSDEVVTAEDGTTFVPYYLSYIYGQNYVQSEGSGVKVKGISIALALNSSQKYISKDGSEKIHTFSRETLSKFAKDAATKIVNNIRQQESFRTVPIVLSVYQTNSATNFVSGGHFLHGYAKASEGLSNFQEIDQKTVFVVNRNTVDQSIREIDDTFASNILQFHQSIPATFSSVSSVNSVARISDKKITKMRMTVDVTSGSYMEVQAVKQFIEKSQEQNFNDVNFLIETQIQLYGETKYTLLKQPGAKPGELEL